METFYLIIVIFIFLIAIFDLSVGVSNDAVNFLNSAIGAKAAPFKVIMAVAAIGIFVGASMSNGMMDIARHGIYQPQYFYNERNHEYLVGGHAHRCSFTRHIQYDGTPHIDHRIDDIRIVRRHICFGYRETINSAGALQMGDLINTDKALQVIVAIFVSVAIAFFFGVLVQYIARLIFKFNYQKQLKYFGALFGGIRGYLHHLFHTYQGIKRVHADDPRKPPMDSRQHTNTFRLLLPMHDNTHAGTHVVSHKHFENSRLVGNFCSGISFCGK